MNRAAAPRARTYGRRNGPRPALAFRPVPPGVVEVERVDDEWWLVVIGRERTVKKFNITRAEAAELVRVLRERVLTLDGGEP